MFCEHAHCFLYGALELWIVSRDYIFGPVFNVDVGRDAFVLDGPFVIAREEAAARGNHRSAINKGWRVGSMDKAAPRAFAHKQSDLPVPEHVRHQIAA